MTRQGIDISAWQDGSVIDYKAAYDHLLDVGRGLMPFAIVKLTEQSPSGMYVNPFAERDINGFRDAGCAVGGYLFFHPAVDVDAQIRYALDNRHGVEVILVDSETDNELPVPQTAETTHNCLTGLSWHLIHAGLYADLSNVEAWDAKNWGFPIFLAEYGVTEPSLTESVYAWQTGNTDPIPGLAGPVDHDVWIASDDAFNRFFKIEPVTPVPVPDPPPPPAPSGDFPHPSDAHGDWTLAQIPGSEASFYLVNLVTGEKHTFDSKNADAFGGYVRAQFPFVNISIKVAESLREV